MTYRVYSVAKEVKADSQEVLAFLLSIGIKGKGSALASLTDEEANTVRQGIGDWIRAHPKQAPVEEEEEDDDLLSAMKPPVRSSLPNLASGERIGDPPKNTNKIHRSKLLLRETPNSNAVAEVTVKTPATSQAPKAGIIGPLMESPSLRTDDFLISLFEDADEALQRLDEIDSAFHRRTYVRTFFSTAEAILSTLADRLSKTVKRVSMAKRDAVFISSALRTIHRNVAHPDTVQFVLSTCGFFRNRGEDFFSGDGWEAYKSARKIRNALTHPTRTQGVEVSNEAIEDVRKAHKWLLDTIEELES